MKRLAGKRSNSSRAIAFDCRTFTLPVTTFPGLARMRFQDNLIAMVARKLKGENCMALAPTTHLPWG